MARAYEVFSEDPGQNTKPSPIGAGEQQLTYDRISDTFRYIMSAVAQLAADTSSRLQGMAFQSPDDVAITGGNIRNVELENVSIGGNTGLKATDTERFDGLTRQALYNLVYPVGSPYLSFNASSAPRWPGTTSTWVKRHSGRFLKVTDDDPEGTGGSGTLSGNTGQGGAGNTGDTVLTMANMPSTAGGYPGVLTQAIISGTPDANPTGFLISGDGRVLNRYYEGTNTPHRHTTPNHTHPLSGIANDPSHVLVVMWVRTA